MELQREELERLYLGTFRGLQKGSIIKGKIIQINPNGVIVDIGSKWEGFIPLTEFADEQDTLKPEDEIEVYVVEIGESEDFIKLSRQRAKRIKTWKMLEEALEKDLSVEGKIVGKVKGGMTVDIEGIKAFLPGSQVDLKAPKNLDHLIGQVHRFKVIKLNNRLSNVIVSRRLFLEEERQRLREETLKKLKQGAIVEGKVKNLTDYGAFIDLGGIDGLLHISDMSWGRITHPSELFRIGDTVEVVVLTFDPDTQRVTLGYKQKKPDPWTYVKEKYPPGKKVLGKIVSITDYGIFVELEEGVEGLVHISEIDWSEKIKKPSRYFSIGEKVEVLVLKINPADRKISLSIKQLKPNPWKVIKEKYSVGQKITGRVRSLTDFGAFISLNEGIDALLHISDICWTKHIKHPSEVLKKGQQVEVVILSIEPEKERISVGLRDLTPDSWG